MQKFVDDDAGYLHWLATHPQSYVLNVERSLNRSNLVLHRSTCTTINGAPSRGVQWTKDYVKFCGERQDLEAFARNQIGGEARPCGHCRTP